MDDFEPTQGLIVEKGKLAANEDYNLSGQRYRDRTVATSNFPIVPLSELAKVKNGFAFKSKEYVSEGLRVLRIKNVQEGEVIDDDPKFIALARRKEFTDFALKSGDILMSLTGNVGRVGRLKPEHEPAVLNQRVAHICPYEDAHCLPEFLFPLLNTDKFKSDAVAASSGIAQANLSSKWVGEYQIPLPPLEVQKEIVAEIEGYQKVIDGARAVVDNYRPHIAIDPDWPMVRLGEVCERLQYGLSARLNTKEIGYKTFRMNELIDGKCVDSGNMKCCDISAEDFAKYRLVPGDILFNRTNSFEHVGRTGVFDLDGDYCFASYLIRLSVSEDAANTFYVNAFMNTEAFQAGIKQYATRAVGQSNINAKSLAAYRIPVPPLTTQSRIVAEIEAEQALVNANRELIDRFEKKIQDTLARVWGDAEPDTAEA